ncbi:MAG TPA: ATP-binding protein [Chitinophagaceae bacterium]|nr:ATP-binding protein [Chitinophagaceae bacterium]
MNGLFDFTLQNPAGALIAFIPGLINLGLLLYMLAFLPRNRTIQVFALLTLTLFFWQINDTIMRSISNKQAADRWDTLFSFSWSFVGPLMLHFALFYSRINKLAQSRLGVIVLYLPGFIFMSIYQGHFYTHQFTYSPFWGWVNNHNNNLFDIIYVYWIALLVIIAAMVLFFHSIRIKNDHLLRNQSLLITAGLGFATLSGLITQVFIPVILKHPSIPLTSTSMTVFSVATVISLKKYKLFRATDLISNETLVDLLPIMIFSISNDNRLTYANPFFNEIFRIKPGNAYPQDAHELLHYGSEEDKQKFWESWNRASKGEQVGLTESSFMTPGGKMAILLSANPIINNKMMVGVLFTARDITELKKTEMRMKYKETQLEEAQQLSHIGSWEWNIRSDKVSWSDEVYRIFGYQPGELQINYATFLDRVAAEQKEEVHKQIEQAIHSQQPFSFYHSIIRNDGSLAIMYSRGRVTLADHAGAVRMNGTIQDVTELKTKEQMLESQNRELQKINSELDRFVYSVSHDLRAPLASMLGIIDISEEGTTDMQMLSHLNMMKASMEKLDGFILDILSYSRNSRTAVEPKDIDFNSLIEDILLNYEYVNGIRRKTEISLELDCPVVFRCDKSRLIIILNNLLSNAIHYTDPSSADSRIRIKVAVTRNDVRIEVADNGIGIDSSLQEKIFEMFFRGTGNSKGSGLGLYIVKETLQKLNGRISVESAGAGKGTTFHLSIPQPGQNLPNTADD